MSELRKACNIFDFFLADRTLTEEDYADFLVIIQDVNHPIDAAMAVSGLTLSLIEYQWRKESFQLLLKAYAVCREQLVRERIIVGLILAMIKNNAAIRENEDIWGTIQEVLIDDSELSFTALCNIARTSQVRQLEKFNQEMAKDIMPLMSQPESDEFYNVIRKHQSEMERITRMALDQNFLIFKSSYHTDFFRESAAHWFLPWDDNQLLNVGEEHREQVEELLNKWSMCDSDKYALIGMSGMLLSALKGQFHGDMLYQIGDQLGNMNIITNGYVQQLYRYFRLSSFSHVNPFELVTYLRDTWIYRMLVVGEKARKVIGELL